MKNLYIDIGSTNIKSLEDGGKIERIPFPAPVLNANGKYEVNPFEIVGAVRRVVDSSSAERVFFSTQMHGYLLADGKGNLLTNYISWRDRRAETFGIVLPMKKENGVDMKPNLPRAGVEAVKRERPDLFAQAKEFFTLGSYVAFSLTKRNASHITDLAASGFYNVKKRSTEPFSLRLPEAYYDVAPVGEYGGKTIYAPVGDTQCAAKGSGGDDGYVLNLGTAAQCLTRAEGFVCGDFESRPYFNGATLCTVTGLPGGGVIGAGKEDGLCDKLYGAYSAALRRLPERKKIVAIGGTVRFHRELIENVLQRIGLPFSISDGEDALSGLQKIAAENEN
ncbi:MAG: FGGY family carbohydrate kinase [Candidatus Borkfalkiaceae bacterium]|nr:FGGY family carbohydrate kinase [Clostridia bacterium]MDY6223852.1 FGGY family carbohydrate kinase [Christensenellaceae bacterium]